MRINRIVCSVIAMASFAASASAAFTTGSLFTVPSRGEVVVSFKSQSAGATGSVYLLGVGEENTITYAASSDARNLGQFIFSNKGTAVGTQVNLGIFEAGQQIHFAYTVTHGAGGAKTGDTSRTDIVPDRDYFGFRQHASAENVTTHLFGIEDIRDRGKSDWDYNDVQFYLTHTATTIPGPGTAMLAVLGILLAKPRRKNAK